MPWSGCARPWLDNMGEATAALKLCKGIEARETRADNLWRSGVSRLYREETDAIQVLKVKGMYQILEDVLEAAENMGQTLEEVILANA